MGWIIHIIQNRNIRLKDIKFKIPLLVILLFSTLALTVSPDIKGGLGIWKAYFLEAIMFFVVLFNSIKTKEDKKIILKALAISTIPIAFLAIYQKFTGFGIAEPIWTGKEGRRVTSFFTSPNAVGLYLGPIVLIMLGWFESIIEDRKLKKSKPKSKKETEGIDYKVYIDDFLIGLVILTSLAAIIFTQSQGTWIGLMVGTIFLLFFGWSKKWTASIVMVLIIAAFAVPISREKLIPIITFQDHSGQNRLELWDMSKDYLMRSPKNFIMGGGYYGFSFVQNQYRDPLQMEELLYPHNIFLNFWMEIGLLGLTGFIAVIVMFFLKGFKTDKRRKTPDWLKLAVMASMVAIIVHGLIDVPYFKNDLSILFWVIVGLL